MNGNSIEITSRELEDLAPGSFLLIDLRDQTAYDHGCIPGALNMDPDALMAGECSLPADKKIVLYCKYGIISEEAALFLREKGQDACHLAQGYGRWALEAIQKEAEDEKKRDAIEKSLTKKFRRDIFSRFTKAIVQYEMLSPGDKVAVCISGGKDSMLMAKLFQELLKHDKFPFELVFLCMDPGYSEDNRRIIEGFRRAGEPVVLIEDDYEKTLERILSGPLT